MHTAHGQLWQCAARVRGAPSGSQPQQPPAASLATELRSLDIGFCAVAASVVMDGMDDITCSQESRASVPSDASILIHIADEMVKLAAAVSGLTQTVNILATDMATVKPHVETVKAKVDAAAEDLAVLARDVEALKADNQRRAAVRPLDETERVRPPQARPSPTNAKQVCRVGTVWCFAHSGRHDCAAAFSATVTDSRS